MIYRKTMIGAMVAGSALLSGCGQERPVTVSVKPTLVEVPVSAPCVQGTRPDPVAPVRNTYSREQWNALTTDQREKILGSNGMSRKAYGDKLYVATAGCP
jgi:hypothetical protein